jgi:uncharacterized small protein (DUF1192 family)
MFDGVAELEAVAGRVACEPLDVPDVALSARVTALARTIERLQAELVRSTAAWDGRHAWAADGSLDPRPWLVEHIGVPKREAHALVRSARHVRTHERTAKALATGDVTVAHVDLLARAAGNGREALYAEHEDVLLDAARTVAPEPFRRVARRWSVLADDELARRDASARFDQRHLDVAVTFDGRGIVNGGLDPDATALLNNALRMFDSGPDPTNGPEAPRTATQRRADAFVDIIRTALAAKGKQPGFHAAFDVVIDIETLAGVAPRDAVRQRADVKGVGPVARATIERLLCDSAVRRVLTDSAGEVLDLGRRSRLASPAQRRALAHRDQGCVFPGCDRPPYQCDAHHLVAPPNGPTDLANLALLCRRHHVLVHEKRWRLGRNAETGRFEARPP